ncbi:MAG: hypothetical protein QOE70_3197 [Chthoniobacter sp.]|jgi:cytochrome c553|nr:hypothetical protein [Chthoniobacter sp.]
MFPSPWLNRFAAAAVAVILSACWTLAAEPAGGGDSAPPIDDVLGLLETHCVKCHGGEKTKGGLDLVTREGLLRGGESGAAIEPTRPEASLLLETVRHETEPHMPHKKDKLPDTAIAQLTAWIKAGAPYSRPLKKSPDGAVAKAPAEFAITEDDRSHWAFQPIQRPAPPATREPQRVSNPIDSFILAKLETRGLSFSPPASKELLIRRVTFDLIGLPPEPQEIDAFVNDPAPDAYERVVDRLLASPHYGERWGRHWLDLARYAETDGFEYDSVRPHSWRYRDYVVRAFNDDKPYDRFIREQLAGDELWPGEPDALVATGFNLLGPDMVDSSDQVQRRHNTLNDMTDTAALAFLGLTAGCARCHDHKFEPISQRDYYSLQACFVPATIKREQPVPTPEISAAYEAAMQKFNEHPLLRELAELERPARETVRQRKLAKLSPEARSAHATPPDERTAEQANLVLETESMVAVADKEVADALSGESAARHKELAAEVKKLPKPEPLPKAMVLGTSEHPPKTFVLQRGEYSQPGEEVAAAIPAVLRPAGAGAPKAGAANDPKPRAMLANWIASPQNPLTARVMVNRIWQHHFGRGLVATPSDFGTHGQKPSHRELLDWLASEFIARDWSVKQMHKLMLMSATYRQSSSGTGLGNLSDSGNLNPLVTGNSNPRKLDPENRLYWRMNRLRLEGEAIRDSLLAISGQLNPEVGGPGVFPPIPKAVSAGAKGWAQNDRQRDYSRRSIYIFARRNLRFPFLEVFDAPDNNLSCPSRERSTTAPQSLTLLNAEEVTTAATATAQRLMKEADSTEARIALATRLVLGRAPKANELALARAFLTQSPLSEFCRALFNLNDFIYVE